MKISLSNAIIERISTRADNTIKVQLGLPELPPEEMTKLFSALNKEVVEVEFEPELEGKSQSERLRNVLFCYWKEHLQDKYKDFKIYYQLQTEKIINRIKDELN